MSTNDLLKAPVELHMNLRCAQNADKENAYGLSKQYIESTFGPYLNNEGKLNFTYDPTTGEKINKDKEETKPKRYGGSVKKIKLKLRK